jgi:hypothetical protein
MVDAQYIAFKGPDGSTSTWFLVAEYSGVVLWDARTTPERLADLSVSNMNLPLLKTYTVEVIAIM